MVQSSASLASSGTNRILCYYMNVTSQLQIVRVADVPNFRFERVVFPGERFLFETIPEALLKVYGSVANCEALLNQFPCLRLRVLEGDSSPLDRSDAVDG